MEAKDATVIPYHKSNRGRSANVPKQRVPARKQAAGRKAFQGDYCEYHGPIETGPQAGTGCSKFGDLDTSGLGKWKPPFYRTFLVFFTKAVKPAFIIGFAAIALYAAFHFIGGALQFGHSLPGSTDRGVSNNVRHTPNNSVPNSIPKSHGSVTRSHSDNAAKK